MDNNEEIGSCELSLEWQKLEESWGNPIVQSVDINQEQMREDPYDNEGNNTFDFRTIHAKLDKMFSNIGGSAQSSEFGGNDVWLIKGTYPLTEDGQSATLLFADDDVHHGANHYGIHKRTVVNGGEYQDDDIAQGTIEEILPIAQKIKSEGAIKEATYDDNGEETFPSDSDEAIERRARDEEPVKQPHDQKILLQGPPARELMGLVTKTGVTHWTDGFQGNGPYLPPSVEAAVLEAAGNHEETPFHVWILNYNGHPMDMDDGTVMLQYEETELRPETHFGNRDMGA